MAKFETNLDRYVDTAGDVNLALDDDDWDALMDAEELLQLLLLVR